MQILQWGTFAVGPWRCLAAGRLSGAFYWLDRGFVLLGWLSGAFHRSARGFALLRVVSVRWTCGPATVLPRRRSQQRGKCSTGLSFWFA